MRYRTDWRYVSCIIVIDYTLALDRAPCEGGFRTFELDKAPPSLIDIAVRAARPIGEGLYGVDVKETDRGFIVMEVNDNPNLEHGIEDQVGKDEIWVRVLKWFIE